MSDFMLNAKFRIEYMILLISSHRTCIYSFKSFHFQLILEIIFIKKLYYPTQDDKPNYLHCLLMFLNP